MKNLRTGMAMGIATGLLATGCGGSSRESAPAPKTSSGAESNVWVLSEAPLESFKLIQTKDGGAADEPENTGRPANVYDPMIHAVGNITTNQVFGIDCKDDSTSPVFIEVKTTSNVIGYTFVVGAAKQQIEVMRLSDCTASEVAPLVDFLSRTS